MKSLVAWSQDRQARELQDEAHLAEERRSEQDALSAEFDGVIAKLVDGLPFYGMIECFDRQRVLIDGWMKDQSALIKTGVDAQIAEVKQTMLKSVTDVIGPLLQQVLKDKAVSDVCGLLEDKFSDLLPEHATIRVPDGLHDAFTAQLAQRGLRLTVEAGPVQELSIQTGDTRIETQLQPALLGLEKVLAA